MFHFAFTQKIGFFNRLYSVYLFYFISSFGVCIYIQYLILVTKQEIFFCDYSVVRNQASNKKYLLELIEKDQKFMKRIRHVNVF